MDGNGRWAKRKLLPRSAGHRAGFQRMTALTEYAFGLGVKYITLYALSAENLLRPKEEIEALFTLFRTYFAQNVERLLQNGIRLRVIGDRSLLPDDVVALIAQGEKKTEQGENGVLLLAIAYGARQEIVAAVNEAVRRGKEVTERDVSALLSTDGIPDPDLVIRTGKEKRLSNFLLWQSAYAELYFSDKMFPAFSNADLDRALKDYAARERRFGNVGKSE